jgi:hypothetical protein
LLGPNTVSAEGFYIFLSKYSKGNPCHGILLIYINKKGRTKEVYTGIPLERGETANKGKEKTSYLKVLTISKKRGFLEMESL